MILGLYLGSCDVSGVLQEQHFRMLNIGLASRQVFGGASSSPSPIFERSSLRYFLPYLARLNSAQSLYCTATLLLFALDSVPSRVYGVYRALKHILLSKRNAGPRIL